MTQYARPNSTVAAGTWTASTGTLHGATSDESNATWIRSLSTTTDYVTLGLGSVTDPASSADHVLKVRVQGVGSGGPERFSLDLLQGATVIAAPFSSQTAPRGTWTELSYTLIAVEADAITDYTALRVRITPATLRAGESVQVSEVWLEVPDNASTLTVADLSGSPTVDAVVLTGTHILTVADARAPGTVDAVVLDQQGAELTVADVSATTDITPRILADTDGEQLTDTDSELLTDDPLELAQSPPSGGTISGINDWSVTTTVDNVDLTGTHILTVADARAPATVDGGLDVVVVFEISQFDGGGWDVSPTIDNVDLTGLHYLVVQDVGAGATVDALDIGTTLQVADARAPATTDNTPLAVGITVADARTIGRVRNLTVDQVYNLGMDDMSVTATFEGALTIDQFFTGKVGLTLDTRSLTLTLDTRSLTLTVDTRTGG